MGSFQSIPRPQYRTGSFVSIHGQRVPVLTAKIPETDVSQVLSTPPFSSWAANLGPRFDVSGIELESINKFGSRVGFVKFRATCTVQGNDTPGIVFARGPAVAILAVLICQEDGSQWVLCCRQPRVPAGRLLLELLAGMTDGSGYFCGVAAKEMWEEAGLRVHESELTDLTELAYGAGTTCGPGGEQAMRSDGPALGVYLSAGGCDVRTTLPCQALVCLPWSACFNSHSLTNHCSLYCIAGNGAHFSLEPHDAARRH